VPKIPHEEFHILTQTTAASLVCEPEFPELDCAEKPVPVFSPKVSLPFPLASVIIGRMKTDPQLPEFNESLAGPMIQTRFRSWGMSLITHVLLGCLLWLCAYSKKETPQTESLRRGGIVLTVKDQSQPEKYLQENDLIEELTESKSDSSTDQVSAESLAQPPAINVESVSLPDQRGASVSLSITNISAPGSLATMLDASQLAKVPPGGKPSSQYQLSAADLELIEADRKRFADMQPVGEPTTISVFGSGNLTGRSFVFVLDRSKSMGAGGLGVIQAAQTELSQAIKQLEPHHLFQIIGYHHQTVTMNSRKLLAASEVNQERVFSYISGLAAVGGTEHEKGLLAALAFQPDVIVLLTDGDEPGLNNGQLKLLREIAGNKTEIHCLQFGFGPPKTTNHFMTKLAADNRGRFRYVDVNQWGKEK